MACLNFFYKGLIPLKFGLQSVEAKMACGPEIVINKIFAIFTQLLLYNIRG